MKILLYFFLSVTALFLVACVGTQPLEDYVLAHQAFLAAKASGGEKEDPANYIRAEEEFRRAKKDFDHGRNSKAKKRFIASRKIFESVENKVRIRKQKDGEIGP